MHRLGKKKILKSYPRIAATSPDSLKNKVKISKAVISVFNQIQCLDAKDLTQMLEPPHIKQTHLSMQTLIFS